MTRQQQLKKLIREVIDANNDTESEGCNEAYAAATHALAWYIVANEKRIIVRSGPR